MVTLISRTIGVAVVLGLAVIGADTLLAQILLWKRSYDKQYDHAGQTIVQ